MLPFPKGIPCYEHNESFLIGLGQRGLNLKWTIKWIRTSNPNITRISLLTIV